MSSLFAVILASLLFTAACVNKTTTPRSAREEVCVTVFDGEHYKVKGDNKKTVKRGENVAYEIALDQGYELVSSFGAECTVPPFKGSYTFNQSVQFTSVNYDTTVTLQTRKLETAEFSAESNVDGCEVEVQTASGYVNNGEIYADDVVNLYAIPAEGYRFHCWSTGNYLSAGGKYLSNEKILNEFDFKTTSELFANFKSTADSARTIIYDFGEDNEIEQDCSAMVAHHPRANTLTEPDLLEIRGGGYELPEDKMLVGWNTEDGEYVGLGSRTAVSDETFITLTPVWKEYSPESDFEISDGKITNYAGESKEVVIPKAIGGEEVTGIAANAFEECAAETYYVPNTVISVEENAFLNCTALKEFYMSDNIMDIKDESFRGCKNFTTLHLNAYLKPRYITDYGSLKGETYDKIIKDADKQKCVVLGGSSVSYAYNTNLSEELFNKEYYVYNLGYNMAMCGYAYYDIIDNYLNEGDLFIHAPELNGYSWCSTLDNSILSNAASFCIANRFLFEICECNWQFLSELHIRKYSNLISSFNKFNNSRLEARPQEYYWYYNTIDDGQVGGQTITGEEVHLGCGELNHVFGFNGNIKLFTEESLIKLADTNIYKPLMDKGVYVCVTFAPINRHNLYLTYGNEDNLKTEADKYTQKIKDIVSDGVHVLLSQYDTIYNGELFANTDYHLGYPTRDVHTRKVINALIEELKKNGGGV